MKILIVGGVAGGASTAARLRRLDEDAEIIVFEKGKYISFANCGLPYYIGGEIKERSSLLLQTPESFNAWFNVDIRVSNEVLSIDDEAKTVKVLDKANNKEYVESYDKLILSPGSVPLRPPIKGIEQENIFTLWTINDVDKIKTYVDTEKPKRAVVVGAGFIGLEMVENLVGLGVEVDLVEMQNQVLTPLDFEMAQIVHRELIDNGVGLHLKNAVCEFIETEDGIDVVLGDGTKISTDMVMLSLGVRPQTDFLKDSKIALNAQNGIIVDDYLQTNLKDIYAVGDAIEVNHLVSGKKTMIPLAGPANRQGRLVADNIAGEKGKYAGSYGTSIVQVFSIQAANTGLNEKDLIADGKKYGKDYFTVKVQPNNHTTYFPGATPLYIKAIFDYNKKLLGAQVLGNNSADKQIDVFATLIKVGADFEVMKSLELAYAPQFSSGKSPVNMVGFVAENIYKKKSKVIEAKDLKNLKDAIILDVRTEDEYLMSKIPGAISLELSKIRNEIKNLDKDKTYVVYCAAGFRGYFASQILMNSGFKDVYNLLGGFSFYNSCNYQIENKSKRTFKMANDLENIINSNVKVVDATGLACPGPILRVREEVEKIEKGDILEFHVTDIGFRTDIATWCERTGNTLLGITKDGNKYIAKIKKGNLAEDLNKLNAALPMGAGDDKTIVCFSGDLDKAIAALIIANGAVSMGRKVTIFFTFWGLNIIRKDNRVKVKKSFIGKMFGMMMPRGAKKLKLSKMNMAGAGSAMIKGLMKSHNVPSLEAMLQMALRSGVRMIACNMSMDLMSIKGEELIEGVDFGGVASYLGAAETADTNLFI